MKKTNRRTAPNEHTAAPVYGFDHGHLPISDLKSLGYIAITSAYESSEKEMFHAAIEELAAGKKDYRVGLDRIGRKVIMRLKSEVKLDAEDSD